MSSIDRAETEEIVSANTLEGSVQTSYESIFVRLLREPLLHFLLLGGALFVAYAYLQGDEAPAETQIVVSAGKIEHLAALFTRTWQRPPTSDELMSLVNDYVREEVAYREGLAIGLEQNDTIIRRRIRQKLDFVAQDLASQLEPTDNDLKQYLEEHADEFRIDPRLSFRQVYFDPERHGDDLDQLVSDLVARLRDDSSIKPQEQGDRTLLEFGYENVSTREIENLLGKEFAEALVDLKPGAWYGPIRSAYGVHVVIADHIQPSKRPKLDQVRDAVRREWEHDRHRELTEKFYQGLIDRYDISIVWPELAREVD